MFKSCLIPLFDWLNHHVGCLNILNHPPFPARHSRPVCQVESCQRAYQLLRSKLDFPKEDIIFDCLLTPVGSEVPASVKDDL